MLHPSSMSKNTVIYCLYLKYQSTLKQAPYGWNIHWNCLTSFTLNILYQMFGSRMIPSMCPAHTVSVTHRRYDEITGFLGCRHASTSSVQSVQSKCPAEWRTPTKVTIYNKQQLFGIARFLQEINISRLWMCKYYIWNTLLFILSNIIIYY